MYAYTWAPADDATSLDALATVTAKDAESGESITLYVKETTKENIVFLNASSMLAKDKQQTAEMVVIPNNVYDANSAQIATITENEDGTLTYETLTNPTEYESGLFITYKVKGVWSEEVEFIKTGTTYTVSSLEIPASSDVKIYFRSDNKQIGPIDDNSLVRDMEGKVYEVGFNDKLWWAASANGYEVVYDSSANTVTFKTLYINFYGVFRSDEGVLDKPVKFIRPDMSVTVYTTTFDAGVDSQFLLYKGYNDQTWNKGERLMPDGPGEVTGNYDGLFVSGSSSVWLLDCEVPFGSWTVTVNNKLRSISFARTVQAILVNGKPAELTDGSWSGSLAEGDAIEFNINGTYYTLGTLTEEQDGTNKIYSTELVEGDAKPIDFAAEEAIIKVDGTDVTITVAGAFKPQMIVGTKTIDLVQSGNFLVAYDVEITDNDAISFSIDGKNYVPEMPATIAYESYSVTLPLKQEEGSATFADVKSKQLNGGEIPFITDTFKPNIRVNSDASAVTFIWDTQTGVDAIESDSNGSAVYYNLQGIRVDNPVNGIFIEVKDGKAVKVQK